MDKLGHTDSKELLAEEGEVVHMFVPTAEGQKVNFDRRVSTERALQTLTELAIAAAASKDKPRKK